jgi:hypothetical protein
MVGVAREAMLSIGCIQAQRCHTDRCPTGVATQSRRRQRGLDPGDKSVRCANYVATLRHELLRLARACGHDHPSQVRPDQVALLQDRQHAPTLAEVFGYPAGWGVPRDEDVASLLGGWPEPPAGDGR